ncbi:hypothetical protein M9Y10_018198 [Tritrichomonas musculus]|uniref:F5/8 type C domain-containing protein n=1 Tax=Tritrichomonas musculus TaxID=1915356 RepID=A0ABR2HNV5_9EUKA
MRDKAKGSVEEIKLIGGSQHYPNYPIDNLLLFDETNTSQGYMCLGVSKQHAWIEWDFCSRKKSMTSYTIQALYKMKDRFQPKTWKFMGSNDHEKWELIDYKEKVDEMNVCDFSGHFECMKKGEFYRYIKYIQIDGCLSWLAYKLLLKNIEYSSRKHSFVLKTQFFPPHYILFAKSLSCFLIEKKLLSFLTNLRTRY